MTSDSNVIPWPKPDPERSNDRGMVTILLDLSGSMNNELKDEDPSRDARITTRIAALEDGLRRLVSPDNSSSMHSSKGFDGSVEFALGYFPSRHSAGHVDWCQFPNARATSGPFYYGVDITEPPELPTPAGLTPLGEAIIEALSVIERRRVEIRDVERRTITRPSLFVITDGVATTPELIPEATRQLRAAEDAKRILFFALGTYDASIDRLMELAPRSSYDLHKLSAARLIEFLSTSMTNSINVDSDADADSIYEYMNRDYVKWDLLRQNLQRR